MANLLKTFSTSIDIVNGPAHQIFPEPVVLARTSVVEDYKVISLVANESFASVITVNNNGQLVDLSAVSTAVMNSSIFDDVTVSSVPLAATFDAGLSDLANGVIAFVCPVNTLPSAFATGFSRKPLGTVEIDFEITLGDHTVYLYDRVNVVDNTFGGTGGTLPVAGNNFVTKGETFTTSVNEVQLGVQASLSQTANVFEVKNSAGTTVAGFNSDGLAFGLDKTVVSGQTLVTAASADSILISDASDSGELKRVLVSDFAAASGDVVGPASAVDENIASFDSTTGKLIKDSGINTSAITANTAKVTYPSVDSTKVGFISVTQAVDLDTMESDIAGNNAKVSNVTHTGEVTGDTALTLDSTAVTNQGTVTPVSGDFVLLSDTSDSGNLKKVDASNFLGSFTGTIGQILVNDGAEFVSVDMSGDATIASDGTMTVNAGASDAVFVDAKVDEVGGITKGDLVYISGASSGKPTVSIADNTDYSKADILAMAIETKTNNQSIVCTTMGLVENIDTSAFSEGDVLYLGAAGAFTNIHPTGIDSVQRIGHAVNIHASSGSIILEKDQLTIINDHDGTMRHQIVNQNAGTASASSYTLVNDAGHRASFSLFGSNTFAPDAVTYYNEGYGLTAYTVAGNQPHIWFTDVTDSHDTTTSTEKMRLAANGDLTIFGTVDGRDVAADGTAQDSHIADGTLHFTEASIDHTAIANIGTNTHAQIDTHIADATLHFTEGSIDHTAIANVGTNSHAQIDTHVADGTLHFTEGSIDHTAITNVGTNSHAQIDTHIASDGSDHTFIDQDVTVTGTPTFGTLTVTNNAVVSGQVSSSVPTDHVPTGTTQTIDWDDGNEQIMDLGSSTGDVTLTLSNPVKGGAYLIQIVQGATFRDVITPSTVQLAGGAAGAKTLDITAVDNAIDILVLFFDGTNYQASLAQAFA